MKLSNFCKGMGINWDTSIRNGCFLPTENIVKNLGLSDHRLSFTVFGIMLWGLTQRAVTLFGSDLHKYE